VGVFDHVTIRASEPAASERFYDTVLAAIGIRPAHRNELGTEYELDFCIGVPDDEQPVTRGLHIAWHVPSEEAVQAFWQAGVDAGYRSDGEPGPRPQYGDDYYGGFLLDPDGNSAEAVHIAGSGKPLGIDHLWIRVADIAAARAFYLTIAPHAGIRLGDDTPGRVQFRGGHSSFSLIADGRPTEPVHIAFGASENAAVDAFHAAAVDAGYPDFGGPGERPVYHAGYYAAFVRDPDGHNVEVVNHNR
jgi:catechol 2,3-dioxygenase-like lactoylglutathione lyase family enzyme